MSRYLSEEELKEMRFELQFPKGVAHVPLVSVSQLMSERDDLRAWAEKAKGALEWYGNPCGQCEALFQKSCHGSCERALKALEGFPEELK